jgi:hypothetical protein
MMQKLATMSKRSLMNRKTYQMMLKELRKVRKRRPPNLLYNRSATKRVKERLRLSNLGGLRQHLQVKWISQS